MKLALAALTASLLAAFATPTHACTVDAEGARRTEVGYVMNHEKTLEKIASLGGRLDGLIQTDRTVTIYVSGCTFDAKPIYMSPEMQKGMPAACPIMVDVEINNTVCGINPNGTVPAH